MQGLSKSLIQVTTKWGKIMSKITVCDLAFDSKSFINEIAETESTSVNGGSEALTFAGGFAGVVIKISEILQNSFLKGTGILAISELVK